MNNSVTSSRYHVQPKFSPPEIVSLHKEKVSLAPSGCAAAVAFFVLVGIFNAILEYPPADGETVVWACFWGAIVIGGITHRLMYLHALKRATAEQNRRQSDYDRANRERAVAAAANVSSRLNGLLESSYATAAAIPQKLEDACRALGRAHDEFADKAYAPFWDETERAAELLVETIDDLRTLTRSAQEYDKHLRGWRHNFPP